MKEIYDIRENNDPSLRGTQTSKESVKENMIKDPEVISNQFSSVIKTNIKMIWKLQQL